MNDHGQRASAWMSALAPFRRHSFSPEHLAKPSALLVVDMQRYFVDPQGDAFLPDARAALRPLIQLLSAYRRTGLPILFTRHEDHPGDREGAMGRWWGKIMEPGSPQLEIVPELSPLPGEKVIRKHQYSAFHKTDLADQLREQGVRLVTLCGVMTHLCCETTARDAFMNDFDVLLAVDAMASSCEELHIAALKTLASGFAIPAIASDIAGALFRAHSADSQTLE